MAADPADLFCVAEDRSGHCAVVDGNFLYVWGGYVSIEENEVYLPSDELWIYDMDSGLWIHQFDFNNCSPTYTQNLFGYFISFCTGQTPKLVLGQTDKFQLKNERISALFEDLGVLFLDFLRINISGEKPRDRSWHTLTPIGEDRLFLFGGLSSDNVPLSDGWIHSIATNGWKQLTHLPQSRPRLWHTACLGQEGEVMVFGGSKDDLLFMDTGHCNDLLIFQTQPYSLLRLCLDCIGKNAALLEKQIPCLPPKLVQEVLKKITFWAAMSHRQERKAETERQNQLHCT
ncbi:kelch domain-containing protein 1-like [Geothlypis trichas]